jgi:hypothetical protein
MSSITAALTNISLMRQHALVDHATHVAVDRGQRRTLRHHWIKLPSALAHGRTPRHEKSLSPRSW